jgi:hypothetical protein
VAVAVAVVGASLVLLLVATAVVVCVVGWFCLSELPVLWWCVFCSHSLDFGGGALLDVVELPDTVELDDDVGTVLELVLDVICCELDEFTTSLSVTVGDAMRTVLDVGGLPGGPFSSHLKPPLLPGGTVEVGPVLGFSLVKCCTPL